MFHTAERLLHLLLLLQTEEGESRARTWPGHGHAAQHHRLLVILACQQRRRQEATAPARPLQPSSQRAAQVLDWPLSDPRAPKLYTKHQIPTTKSHLGLEIFDNFFYET